MQREIIIVILILAITGITTSSKPVYKQSLTVFPYASSHAQEENLKTISLRFQIPNSLIPIPLSQYISHTKQTIKIQYGTYFHRWTPIYDDQSLGFNSITLTVLQLDQQISEQTRELLQATFAITIQKRYTTSNIGSQEGMEILSHSPNDRYCGHHIQQIVNNILPCASHSGLAQLINIDTMFDAVQNGMRVLWNQEIFEMEVFLVVDNDTNIEGLKKMKVNDRCEGNFQSVLQMNNGVSDISINNVVTDKIIQGFKFNQQSNHINKDMKIVRSLLGNWYSPYKLLRTNLVLPVPSVLPQLAESVVSPLQTKEITMHQLLPKRAGMQQIRIFVNNQQILKEPHNHTFFTVQIGEFQGEWETILDIKISLILRFTHPINFDIRIQLYMQNVIASFQMFQALLGGGTQIPSIPITIATNMAQYTYKVYGPPVVLQTPQPDESLPFQMLTFITATIGYLTLGIWRTAYSKQ